jgi:crossover junction endodeoxyribonuclease RuvC
VPSVTVDSTELMFDMDVLGIDPGVARLGLAMVARRGRITRVIWAQTIRTSADDDESSRLMELADAVRGAIRQYRPGAVAIERVSFNRNVVSALSVARATGALMVVAAEAGLEVQEYAPTEVKSAVTGSGNADKKQVREALLRIHRLADVPHEPDAADAVAVALTLLNGAGLRAVAARAGLK